MEILREVMILAWQFVKKNGYPMDEALRVAWANIKLRVKMENGICRFYYKKITGELREAFGTLNEKLLPPTKGSNRRINETLQIYYDTERREYRSFKKANLLARK